MVAKIGAGPPGGDIRADRRTDAGADGGARADHNRFRSGDLSPPVDQALSAFDPVAALAAARPLVATGGERVQRPQGADLAADFQPSAMSLARPSCGAEPQSACLPRTEAGCLSGEFICARPRESRTLFGGPDSRLCGNER